MGRTVLVLGIAMVVGLAAARAQGVPVPAGVTLKASTGGVTEYDLANGLKVLFYPDPSQAALTVSVTYLVGSRHEGAGEAGMAHLLEHLNFIETTTGRHLKDELVRHGARWNGMTGADRTAYFETMPASDENLRWALDLEVDRMVHVKLTQAILDIERTVVRNELEIGENQTADVLTERVGAAAYLWHAYGRPSIGSRADIEHVPVDRLETFYRRYYQPDNAVLIVAGRFDPGSALRMVNDTVGRVPRPTRVLAEPYTIEPPQDGERFVTVRRTGNTQHLVVRYHIVAASHPDIAALQVLAGVLNGTGAPGGRSEGPGGRAGGDGSADGRLGHALVDTKLAHSASMSVRRMHDPGTAIFSATLDRNQSLDALRDGLFRVLDDVVSHPPTSEEIDRARGDLLREFEVALTDTETMAIGPLSTAAAKSDWRLAFLEHEWVRHVEPADVVRVAQTYFKPSNRTVGYFVPEPAPDRTVVPAAPDLTELLAGFTTAPTATLGEPFDATIANVERSQVRFTLSGGMKVAVLPKQTADGVVLATIDLRFGDRTTLAGQRETAALTGELLMAGTARHTRQEVQDELRRLNGRVTVSGGSPGDAGRGGGARGGGAASGPGNEMASAQATVSAPAEHFAEAFQLAVEMLKEPALSPDAFEKVKTAALGALGAASTDPTLLAIDRLSRYLSPFPKGDPQYVPTREEKVAAIERVTIDDVRRFHHTYYGSSFGALAVVGPVESTVIRNLVESLLGGWTTTRHYTPLVVPYKASPPINEKIETPDKANAAFVASEHFRMTRDDPDYPALLLASYVLGEPITARIPDRIRNREGLSYAANAFIVVPAQGDAASLRALIALNPSFGPRVESSFTDELRRAWNDGFTPDEVASAKSALLDARRLSRSTDAALLSLLSSSLLLNRPLAREADVEARIRSLTADEISAAFRRHIDPSRLSIVKAGDFKRAGVYR